MSKIESLVCGEVYLKLKDFIRSIEFSKSQNTILSYLYDLKLGFSYFATNVQGGITMEFLLGLSILQFRSLCFYCKEKQTAITSQQRMIIAWKVFTRFLGSDSLAKFRMPRKPERYPRALTEDQAMKVVDLPENPTWIDYRNRALWGLMYGSGLRISEALSIRKDQISDCVRIVGKGNKVRVVPILPSVMNYIDEYLEKRRFESEYLFMGAKGEVLTQQSASHIFRVWRDKNHLPKNLTLHSLRHSFATHLLRNNCPLPAVQKLLGHSSLSRTMQYLNISSDQLALSYKKYMESDG